MAESVKKNNSLHKEAITFLELFEANRADHIFTMTVEAARNNTYTLSAKLDGMAASIDGTTSEFNVPVPHHSEGIPITVYKTFSCPANPAILVYFHGGGYIMGCREMVASTCTIIASKANCIVVNVEYRLAPEFKYPACIEDGVAVTRWIMENKQFVGAGSQSIVGVGGDSAGGTISANVCHKVPDVDFQVLINPCLDEPIDYPSHKEFAEGFFMHMDFVRWCCELTFEPAGDISQLSSSWSTENFQKQPPCLMVISDSDVLRDGGIAYAEKLEKAGCHVEVIIIKGMIHGFIFYPTIFKETCEGVYKRTVEFIKSQEEKAKQTRSDAHELENNTVE